MIATSRKFEELEQEVNGRPNVFTGFNLPDTFEDYINCVKMEKRNVLVWKFHGNEDQIVKAYSEWLEEEFKGFNVIDLNAQDPTDELYPEYVRAAVASKDLDIIMDGFVMVDFDKTEMLKLLAEDEENHDSLKNYCDSHFLRYRDRIEEEGKFYVWTKGGSLEHPYSLTMGMYL